jgi:hypothetical protein
MKLPEVERYTRGEWILLRLRMTLLMLRGQSLVHGILVCGGKAFRTEVEAGFRLLEETTPDVLSLVTQNLGTVIQTRKATLLAGHFPRAFVLLSREHVSQSRTWTAGILALAGGYSLLCQPSRSLTQPIFPGDLLDATKEVRSVLFLREVLQRLGAPKEEVDRGTDLILSVA